MTFEVSSRQGRRGFTLIEMVMVLALIAIMAAAVLPEMRGTFEDAKLRSTSRELISALNLAYSRAVTLNQQHRVRFERNNGHYVVEKRARGERGLSVFVPVKDLAGGEGKIDPHITIEIHDTMQMFMEPAEKEGAPPPPAPAPETTKSADDGNEPMPGERGEAIVFYADGTADAREVVLKDRDGFKLVLRVNPITARVNIVEHQPEL